MRATHEHDPDTPGPGHNAGPGVAQWQTPHLAETPPAPPESPPEADFDLIEAAFADGFALAADAPSFLRLAGVPFVGETPAGERLYLLRVEQDTRVDLGSVTPALGGNGFRYAPLPARLASRRRGLAFVYHDGQTIRRLGFAQVRALEDRTEDPAATHVAPPD